MATMASIASTPSAFVAIPLLNSENYANWKFRLSCLLEERKLLEATKIVKVDGDSEKEKDAKARSLIVQCVPDRYLDTIKDAKTSFEMLQCLDGMFHRKNVFSKLHLRKKLLSIKLGETKMEEYLYKFESLVREIENIDKKLDEEDKVCYLLMGLPDTYSTVITAIETLSGTVTYEFVKARLLDEELKKNFRATPEPETVLSSEIECYRCHKKGHIAKYCKNNQFRGRRGKGSTRGRGKPSASSNYASQTDWSVIAISNTQQCNLTCNEKSIKFIIDSGATENIIKEEMEVYMHDVMHLEQTIRIRMANGNILQAQKSGIISIVSNGIRMNLSCLIVPGIAHNLVSVSKLSQKGFSILFDKQRVQIRNKHQVWKSNNSGPLFILEGIINESCNAVIESDDMLWHRRLGHLNRKSLIKMKLPYPIKYVMFAWKAKQ